MVCARQVYLELSKRFTVTKKTRRTYCSIVQKHFFKSQKIRKREQHVENVTGHFIFMVPAKEKGGCFVNE